MIECKQCTIIWLVDDSKISHAKKEVVEDVLKQLMTKIGQDGPLSMR